MQESIDETRYDGVIVSKQEQARHLVHLTTDDCALYSQDQKFDGKLHMHHKENGEILTQINKGSIEDWNRLLDLR